MSATNRGTVRNKNDFYPTPEYTIDSLLNVLNLHNNITFHEPCKGNGIIYNKINTPFKSYCELEEGIDYLITDNKEKFDLIITNPPFSLAKEFINKSLNEANSIWYLLRLNFLGSQTRKDWWKDKMPTHLLVLSKRPSFTNKGTDATEYAWFGWDKINICKLNKGIHIL
jgi:hypothetical protein